MRLVTRNGRPAAQRFPELVRALATLPAEPLLFDGEVVAPDASGRPDFGRLQRRAALRRPAEIEAAAVASPVQYFAFDLLAFEGRDLRSLPLRQRRAWLDSLLPERGPLRAGLWVEERGEELLERVRELGLEGIVAKRADAPYASGRSPHWRKLRLQRSDDFAIVGWSDPRGSRSGFGALHLARLRGEDWVYAGRVGSGFGDAERDALRTELERHERKRPVCSGALPETRGHHWVEPRWVGEVRYTEVTADGLLRHPTWVGLREDKEPGECRLEGERLELEQAPEPEPAAEAGGDAAPDRAVPFSHLDKPFWPDDDIRKGDLLDYHRRIAEWLLPYLHDRPLVLTRYPDGIEGKSFFQKDAPQWVPDWVRTERIWSEHARREVNYFVCDDLESLLYVVNLGTIPLHVWSSRISNLQHPDWCVLDLDPKGAPFAHVVRLARRLHALCEELEVPSFVKTSGASGLHVLLPLGGRLGYEQCRMLAQLLGRVLVQREPEIATLTRRLEAREGKVYVDTLQNGHGQLLVAPFSVRPLPGAPVSMPLRWREVGKRLDPRRYTLRNAAARLRRLGEDPLAGVLGEPPGLARGAGAPGERAVRALRPRRCAGGCPSPLHWPPREGLRTRRPASGGGAPQRGGHRRRDAARARLRRRRAAALRLLRPAGALASGAGGERRGQLLPRVDGSAGVAAGGAARRRAGPAGSSRAAGARAGGGHFRRPGGGAPQPALRFRLRPARRTGVPAWARSGPPIRTTCCRCGWRTWTSARPSRSAGCCRGPWSGGTWATRSTPRPPTCPPWPPSACSASTAGRWTRPGWRSSRTWSRA